jgi:hypothetical protein
MLKTNIPEMNDVPLQFSMLYHPDLEKKRYSAVKYTYPFFTDSVKYPMDMLAYENYSERVDFFFNPNRFNSVCRNYGPDYVDLTSSTIDSADMEKEHENATYNIRCMVILLLPIADEFRNVFKTSYNQFILNQTSSEIFTLRNIDPTTFLNPSWLPLYNYFQPRKYSAPYQEVSYLKQGNNTFVVSDVVWLNDLDNHPIYRDFLKLFHSKTAEKKNSFGKIQKQLEERNDIFATTLYKYKNPDKEPYSKSVYRKMVDTLIDNVSEYDRVKHAAEYKQNLLSFVNAYAGNEMNYYRQFMNDITEMITNMDYTSYKNYIMRQNPTPIYSKYLNPKPTEQQITIQDLDGNSINIKKTFLQKIFKLIPIIKTSDPDYADFVRKIQEIEVDSYNLSDSEKTTVNQYIRETETLLTSIFNTPGPGRLPRNTQYIIFNKYANEDDQIDKINKWATDNFLKTSPEVKKYNIKEPNASEPPIRFPTTTFTLYPIPNTFNTSDNTRRSVLSKIINYLGEVDDFVLDNDITELTTGNSKQANLIRMVDNIVYAYIEYATYNDGAKKDRTINLKDFARILSELYNAAIFIKSANMVSDFIHSRIPRLDLIETNDDGTPKNKLELDIIRVIRRNFAYYGALNDSITNSISTIIEPARRSSNPKLQQYIKTMFKPVQTPGQTSDVGLFSRIYNKYVGKTTRNTRPGDMDYMDTGISIIGTGQTQNKQSDANVTGEIAEIYLYIDMVNKSVYEKNSNRICIMSDDELANRFKQLLYSDTMMDGSFPEVNKYRTFRFADASYSSDTKDVSAKDTENKSISANKKNAVGGTKRRIARYSQNRSTRKR